MQLTREEAARARRPRARGTPDPADRPPPTTILTQMQKCTVCGKRSSKAERRCIVCDNVYGDVDALAKHQKVRGHIGGHYPDGGPLTRPSRQSNARSSRRRLIERRDGLDEDEERLGLNEDADDLLVDDVTARTVCARRHRSAGAAARRHRVATPTSTLTVTTTTTTTMMLMLTTRRRPTPASRVDDRQISLNGCRRRAAHRRHQRRARVVVHPSAPLLQQRQHQVQAYGRRRQSARSAASATTLSLFETRVASSSRGAACCARRAASVRRAKSQMVYAIAATTPTCALNERAALRLSDQYSFRLEAL